MFTVSNPFIEHLKRRFPEAHSFRFEEMYPGQPELEYWDGPNRRVEYIPSLHWKVGTTSFRWAPTPTIQHHFEDLPFGVKIKRSSPNYDHAFDAALEVVEASIKGQEAIDEYNKNHRSAHEKI